jgi:prephenate dehydrogenase
MNTVATTLPKSIGLVGYGRFGRLLVELFQTTEPKTQLRVLARSTPTDDTLFFPETEVCQSELLILSVPIGALAATVKQIAPHLKPGQTVMDVCSVKVFARDTLVNALPEDVGIICSHPMFGPATYQQKGNSLEGLTVTLEHVRGNPLAYQFVKAFFQKLSLQIVEIDAVEHDRLASRFQFITLANAMILRPLGLNRTRIDTASAGAMLDYLEMISVDSQLVRDLYQYNPFCKEQFKKLEVSFSEFEKFLRSAEKEKESDS